MGLVGDSRDNSIPDLSNLNFDEIFSKNASEKHTTIDQKILEYKNTTVFAYESDIKSSEKRAFYDGKQFAKLDKQHLPSSEKILSATLLERGNDRILVTREGEARQLDQELDQRPIEIHQEADDGTEVVRYFGRHDIKIGSLTNEQYARIHSAAMENLTLISRQLKEVNSKEKSEVNLKERVIRSDDDRQGLHGKSSSHIDRLYQRQSEFFSKNRRNLEKSLERLASEERTIIKRKTKQLDEQQDLRTKMNASKNQHRDERKEDVRFKERLENDLG